MRQSRLPGLTGIAPLIRRLLREHRVALIIIEGIGMDDFSLGKSSCASSMSWFNYITGDLQYLAITSGLDIHHHPLPPGQRYYEFDTEDKPYPFSGCYSELPDYVLGTDPGIRSAAVGTRNIITHIASGADICIECFARWLYNYGSMAVVDTERLLRQVLRSNCCYLL